ncbi:hypothetical protein [Sphingomonas corticis]|uniref:Uncharacterized protein n=1 Tax=Sphingomonas corticis TaxID=2722791 RepID=A0ABX1CVV0_9SPHN|nr:hypothetical protein [Sphingomonas corticis]NJR80042.1 hypothetical protein [Sphingomonas corticis]
MVDYDPACDLFYAPVDLNAPHVLAQNGLPPSEGRPQFHQQMVFAVAMRTIRIFERALGRTVLWARDASPEESDRRNENGVPRDFVKRLRIYPHALREANAYYSPEKTALLFGYFKTGVRPDAEDSSWVFTCLSQDIIAHETAHAILHGMHRRSIEATNIDALAFHEAFADIVALFQRFTMTDVVEHQIAATRGELRTEQSLLTGLARQFGQALGRSGALRYALDLLKPLPGGKKHPPLSEALEPHERGAYLVAAVFDAFVMIYERRTADLLRLVLGQSRPDGRELPIDLVRRLASEAGKAADHVLRMCVRALDYLPPVDVHFGEYLRAIITADADLVPDDRLGYRVAIAEAFRKRGISVPGCISMAPDSLMWETPDKDCDGLEYDKLFASLLPTIRQGVNFDAPNSGSEVDGKPPNYREESIRVIVQNQHAIWTWLVEPSEDDEKWEGLLGVRLTRGDLKTIPISPKGKPAVEVHSARIARRAGPSGEELVQLIVQIVQRRHGYMNSKKQRAADEKGTRIKPDFTFRGGCTLHIDLRDGRLRRVIRKRIDDDGRLERQRRFRSDDDGGLATAQRTDPRRREPFAFMHGS